MPNAILTADSEQLLKLIFGAEWEEAWVCWKSNMTGCRVLDLPSGVPAGDDIYFSIAEIAQGASTRSLAFARRVKALVIDDVGTKVSKDAMELMAPTPNWVIESSAGNFQYGYCIDLSVQDFEDLRRGMKSNPIWGKSDGIDAVHLFRLPQGCNTKSQNPFHAKLISISNSKMDLENFGSPRSGGTQGSGSPTMGCGEPLEPLELKALVDLIPNDRSEREHWVSMAHAIWGASDGLGFQEFVDWSARWTCGADDLGANTRLWDSITSSSIGTYWLVREAGAAGQAWWGRQAAKAFDDGANVQEVAAGGAAVGAVDPFHRTVAWDIERRHGAEMRFVHDTGCWYVFNGSIWEPCPATHKAGFGRAWEWVNRNILTLDAKDMRAVSKLDFLNGVEGILRQRLGMRIDAFDRDPWLLGTPGGTVALLTGVLRPARAEDFISKSTVVTPSLMADCPRWKKFVAEITKGDQGAQVFLQQWLGYCLTGDTSEQVFLFLYGPGGNGKSVLMDTAAWVMGTYFRKPVADLYFAKQSSRHMQEVASLAGARMITVSEVPANAAWDEGKLKDHTGGGQITANFMRQNSFSFVPQFKLTALGNHQPSFPGGMNEAIKRRFKLMLLDFIPKVVERDLMKVLQAEGEGILRWMIEGLSHPGLGWHVGGLNFPQVMIDATDKYVHDQDVFGLWVTERLEKWQGAKTGTTDLFNDWLGFRNANGGGELFGNIRVFSLEMEARGFRKMKLNSNNVYADIRLISKAKSAF